MFPSRISNHLPLALAVVVIAISASRAGAQSTRSRDLYRGETVYPGRIAAVTLQPFSLDEPISRAPAIPVRYDTSSRWSRAESLDQDDENAEPQLDDHASRPIVRGNRALLRNGVAYAPSSAPPSIKAAIWAVNSIRRKPYHWGGGHGSFHDSGYDCSGAVSFALHYAGVLNTPLPSSDFVRYGKQGRGRWITIYSRRGHTFATIAGLRLDTTDFRYGGDVGPRWYAYNRDTWGFEARHPVGL